MRKPVFASGLVAGCAVWMIFQGAKDFSRDETSEAGASSVVADQVPSVAAAPKPVGSRKLASVKDDTHAPLSQIEKDSVKVFLEIFANQDSLNSEKLIQALSKANLKPVVAKDKNPLTGEMEMVRTDNALPGTRYFHAQVFDEGQGASHLQHLSFEIRPGSDAMDTAVSLIKQTHRDLGTPMIDTPEYMLWRSRSGRVVSARKMDAETLKDNYFNAHSAEDVGTIWVTSEDDPEEPEQPGQI